MANNKKKIIACSLFAVIFIAVVYVAYSFYGYYHFTNAAKAAGGFPWQDGGMINAVQLECIKNPTTQECPNCPMVTSAVGPACAGWGELQLTSQQGTAFIGVPPGFANYRGGCAVPAPGMQYIAGGMSNVLPEVIGCPVSASRPMMWGVFDYIMAGVNSF